MLRHPHGGWCMFNTAIGRGRFFAYSAALLVAEIAAALLCIWATIGFEGLATSPPGPSREGLALTILVMSLPFVIVRANFAWRRSRDAGGLGWVLGGYIVFSAIFAILQAGTFLVYEFGSGNSNLGLNLLGLAITGLWFRILLAAPVGGNWDASAFAEQVAAGLRSPAEKPGPASRPRSPEGRPGGFGKRGLA